MALFKPVVIIAFMFVALMFLASHPYAHEGYTGTNDPVTKQGCCGGNDCAPVPLDADWVQPVSDGFRVVLSAEQAKTFNKNALLPIDMVVTWDRVMAVTVAYNGPPAIYHICIVADEVRCLFVATST